MAEIVLHPLTSMIIKTLGSTAVKKIGKLYNVRRDLEKLEGTLSTIRAVLNDAESQQTHNDQVRLWLQRLKDVMNDVDDLVDEVASEGTRQNFMPEKRKVLKKIRIFFSSSNQLVIQRKLSGEIRRIRKRLTTISAEWRDFTLDVTTRPVSIRRETHSFVVEDDVFGRFEDKKTVLEMVLEKDSIGERVRVVSIFGMGGVGKTTLAQLIFNDDIVQKRFDEKLWVCVSDDFDVKVILRSVVKSLIDTSTMVNDKSMEQLQKILREKMNGKSYILVLDDVWSENPLSWRNLMDILSNCGVSGSRIVVTTRSKIVAKLTSSNISHACRLKTLSHEDSWLLFKKIAFKQSREPVEEKIGREIVKKCGGIPLAIRMVGSMLSIKDPKFEWSSFLKNELSSLPQQENGIFPTLKLSYDSLQLHLKQCFAYCMMFPKGCIIHVQTLIMLWIAQGFISASSYNDSRVLEDIGYDHFLELLGKCFFQEVSINDTDKVVFCKMHDLVHDLAIQVAGEEYVCHEKNIHEKTRHASLIAKPSSSLLCARRLRSLRWQEKGDEKSIALEKVLLNLTFLRMLELRCINIKIVPDSIGKLKHLRYLDLSCPEIKSLPNSITELINLQTLKVDSCYSLRKLPRDIKKLISLKHLDLSCTKIKSLPNSITELINLQTLKVKSCDSLRKLPRDIKKLISLKHLEFDSDWLDHYPLSLPKGVSQLTNLQTLSYFKLSEDPVIVSQSCELEELMRLKNMTVNSEIIKLRAMMYPTVESQSSNLDELAGLNNLRGTLVISGLRGGIETNSGILKEKQHLRLVHLKWSRSTYSDEDEEKTLEGLNPHTNLRRLIVERYSGVRFSCWLSSLTNLVELKLQKCTKIKQLSSLKPLCSLRKMHLSECFELEFITLDVVRKDGYFPVLPSLQVMELCDLMKFRGWESPNTAENVHPYFPGLSNLIIRWCPYLTSLPLYPNVKELSLVNTNRKPFEQTVLMSIARSQISASSTLHPLSAVKALCLRCPPKKDAVQRFPDWLRSLSSVETIEMIGYSMSRLTTEFGEGSMEWEIGVGFELETPIMGIEKREIFSSVRKLLLTGLPTLNQLSGLIRYMASVEDLCIDSCKELDGNDSIEFESLTSLRSLVLQFLKDVVALPEWLQRITTLQSLKLSYCQNLKTIPDWLPKLSLLHKLHIDHCPRLFEELDSPNKWESLTSLHTLILSRLPELITLPEGLHCITTLQSLKLSNCCNLKTIPDSICKLSWLHQLHIEHCPRLFEWLDSPNKWESLTSLRTLILCKLPELIALPEGLRRTTNLQNLKLSGCKNLKNISDWICKLSLLHELHIDDCPHLFEELNSRNKWESLTSLRTLILSHLPEMIALPEGLRCVTTLQTLELKSCHNLASLWICHQTESLPGSISSLTSLQNLRINDCQILSNRYGKANGEDWPKIKHIPNVVIQGFIGNFL